MNEEDAVAQMQRLEVGQDEESAHLEGDTLVSNALRHLGWSKLADAYDKARGNWWYA